MRISLRTALRCMILVGLLCTGAVLAAPPDSAAQTKTWSFDEQKITINAPASWENLPSDNPIVILRLKPDITPVPGQFSDVFVITVKPLSDAADHASLDEYAAGAVKGNGKGQPGVKVSDPEDTKVSGEPAKKYTVEKKINGMETKATYVIAHRNHNFYVFLYMASPARADAGQTNLDTLLKSVKWQ